MNTSSSALHECASPTEPPTSEPSDPAPFPKRNWSEQDTLALATAWCDVYKAGVAKDEKTAMTNSRIFDAKSSVAACISISYQCCIHAKVCSGEVVAGALILSSISANVSRARLSILISSQHL
ncbi:hypothetical protein PHYSODRAFT_303851 [Phytophthora sojae]|uniref:Uncharacterized protein n=1 Tax=Phytophthora sojae (strain P6497) TaxID=1094619 RepID=G4ZYM1_PHYSP|nr:hypothetical protein PHYSODRAFT_303851 [Phytophthora sojae]EGZ12054.1 hypothetical protein PHYSODRAFT_303851 [Phytophthora sojae]|eukprot:XP_009532387.1 hypothetical protein PHYSODRAFT_303851 [Phytophthora sojae]